MDKSAGRIRFVALILFSAIVAYLSRGLVMPGQEIEIDKLRVQKLRVEDIRIIDPSNDVNDVPAKSTDP